MLGAPEGSMNSGSGNKLQLFLKHTPVMNVSLLLVSVMDPGRGAVRGRECPRNFFRALYDIASINGNA